MMIVLTFVLCHLLRLDIRSLNIRNGIKPNISHIVLSIGSKGTTLRA